MLRRRWQSAAALSFALSTVVATQAHAAYQTGKVASAGATLFAAPKNNAAKKAKLKPGTVVNVVEPAEGGFYRTTTVKGQTGWIHEDAVVLPKKASAQAPVPPPVAGSAPAASATPAVAAPVDRGPKNVYVGALAGVGVAGGGSSFAFGLDMGYKLSPMWGAGVYLTYLNLQSASTVVSTPTSGTANVIGASFVLLAGEVNYYVPQVPEIHFGAKLGVGAASAATGVTTGTTTTIAPAVGIAGGYDYPLTPLFSIGVEANFFYALGDISTTVFNGLGAIKYTF